MPPPAHDAASKTPAQPAALRRRVTWQDEYMLGLCRQIYRISVPKGFEARRRPLLRTVFMFSSSPDAPATHCVF